MASSAADRLQPSTASSARSPYDGPAQAIKYASGNDTVAHAADFTSEIGLVVGVDTDHEDARTPVGMSLAKQPTPTTWTASTR
ncbi:MAG TPA: hypothetical protein VLH10_13985 [Yinghuangia sp.]|nr:hypothetical protein [Yinghuangia sp.]